MGRSYAQLVEFGIWYKPVFSMKKEIFFLDKTKVG